MKNRGQALPFARAFPREIPAAARFLLRQAFTLVSGFALAQAAVFGSFSPLGVALVAGVPKDGILAASLGASLGYLFSGADGATPLRYIASVVAASVISFALRQVKKETLSQALSCVTAASCCLVTGLALGMSEGLTAALAALYGAESLLAGGAAYFFYRSFSLLSQFGSLRVLAPQETACIVSSFAILLFALAGFDVSGIAPARIAAVLLILLGARCGREAGGSIAGIVAGVAMGFGEGFRFLTGSYAFGGLLAGLFAPLGQFGCAAAFAAANGVVVILEGGSAQAVHTLIETAAATVLFVFLPTRWIEKIESVLNPSTVIHSQDASRALSVRLHEAASGMRYVSTSVDAVSESLKRLYTPGFHTLHGQVRESVCGQCGMKEQCWAQKETETLEAVQCIGALLEKGEPLSPDKLPAQFAGRCIRMASLLDRYREEFSAHIARAGAQNRMGRLRAVIADQFGEMADLLEDLSLDYGEELFFDDETALRIHDLLEGAGMEIQETICRLDANGRMYIEATGQPGIEKLHQKELPSLFQEACGRAFDPPCLEMISGELYLTCSEKAPFTMRTGASQRTCGESALCGDTFETFRDGRGRQILLISDGMGTGGRAAVDAAMASGLFSKLVKSGLGFDTALRIVNSALLAKSEEESFATLDLACFDFYTGACTVCKAGAAASFLRRAGKAELLERASMPAGILREARFSNFQTKLQPGDLILLVSDGALGAGTGWILEELEQFEGSGAQALADRISEEAARKRTDGHADDITVVVGVAAKNQ